MRKEKVLVQLLVNGSLAVTSFQTLSKGREVQFLSKLWFGNLGPGAKPYLNPKPYKHFTHDALVLEP